MVTLGGIDNLKKAYANLKRQDYGSTTFLKEIDVDKFLEDAEQTIAYILLENFKLWEFAKAHCPELSMDYETRRSKLAQYDLLRKDGVC